MPDLILISATGDDSAIALYDQLSTIAPTLPTLVVNYDDKSWQQLLRQLGEMTGREQQAAMRIASFNERLSQARRTMNIPSAPVSALVYNPAARAANLWTPDSDQGQLLREMGFTLATPPAALHASQSMGKQHNIIQLGGENLAAGLNGDYLMLFAGNDKDVQAIYDNPLLAHLPAVKNHRVYALGTKTFRLDYYIASQVLTSLNQLFAAP